MRTITDISRAIAGPGASRDIVAEVERHLRLVDIDSASPPARWCLNGFALLTGTQALEAIVKDLRMMNITVDDFHKRMSDSWRNCT